MVPALLLGVGLLAAAPDVKPAPGPDVLRAYEDARGKAGRGPDAQVGLALWCEAHGLDAERVRHLAAAVLTDPQHAAARGLLGMVEDAGRWTRPDRVADRVGADAGASRLLAEYNARREQAAETADAQWKLAAWCDGAGLKAEALAHYTAVTRLDPKRDAAWKRLGFKKVDGRWTTDELLAAERAEADARKKADRHWRPLLTRWRGWLGTRDAGRRASAEAGLAALDDPRAVPSVWAVFVESKDESLQARAAEVFSRVKAPATSRALAALATSGATAEVRRAAVEALRRRDQREYMDVLIAAVRTPVKYTVRPVGGPGSPGALFVEGEKFDVRRLYAPPPVPSFVIPPNARLDTDPATGLPVIVAAVGTMQEDGGTAPRPRTLDSPRGRPRGPMVAVREIDQVVPIGQMQLEAQKSVLSAERQLENDVAAIDAHNDEARRSNDRVVGALTAVTGQSIGDNQRDWAAWWTDRKGYAVRTSDEPKPTVDQAVPLDYVPQDLAPVYVSGPVVGQVRQHQSCFGAGTLVRTLTGLRPIQDVKRGDLVLTEDATTGRLGFEPVVAVFHNKPSTTLKLDLSGGAVVATGIHRFWKPGTGWVMARDLTPGDSVRTLGGTARVNAVEADAVQPVFNLEVARGQSFFAGPAGALVHDNSLVDRVDAPFDAVAVRREDVGGGDRSTGERHLTGADAR